MIKLFFRLRLKYRKILCTIFALWNRLLPESFVTRDFLCIDTIEPGKMAWVIFGSTFTPKQTIITLIDHWVNNLKACVLFWLISVIKSIKFLI